MTGVRSPLTIRDLPLGTPLDPAGFLIAIEPHPAADYGLRKNHIGRNCRSDRPIIVVPDKSIAPNITNMRIEAIWKDRMPISQIHVTSTPQITVTALEVPSGDHGIQMDLDSRNSDEEL